MFAVVMNSTFDKIERHVEIVVAEGGVLLGIERFEQRRTRIAAEVAPDLVDFVEHEDRIFGLGAANALDDLSRQRADVSAAMAANLGFVVHAAQRDADELASQSARDRLAQRSLAHARRSDEAKDRAFHVRLQTPHRKVIQNAVFDLLQVVVIGVENFLGLRNVDFAAGSFCPRQHRQPLDVVAGDAVIGRHRRHARKAAQFLQGFFLHFVGHAGVSIFCRSSSVSRCAFILLTQFLLDGLHLLAQVVLALRLLDAVLHFGLDLVAQLLDFQFLRQMLVDFFQAHADVGGFERVLLVGGRERRQRGGDEIHQPARLFNVHGDGRKFVRQSRRAGHDLLEQRENVALQRFHFGGSLAESTRERCRPAPA